MKYVKSFKALSLTVIYVPHFSTMNAVGHANDTILGYKPPFNVPTCLLSYLFSGLSQLVMSCYSFDFRGNTCNLVLSTYFHFQSLFVPQPSPCL